MDDQILHAITEHETLITCADGVELGATIIRCDDASHVVLISSGTEFPQSYYLALARYFAARGTIALVYDYRGIGASMTAEALNTADIPYWGALDLAACIDWLQTAAPDRPLFHLGHSVGGHRVGFASNAGAIRRHAFVAVGSGTWWRHPPSRWPMELYFWWGIGGINLTRSTYIKPGFGWAGGALPGPAFRTWRRWSHSRRYYRNFIETSEYAKGFAAVDAPVRSWIFTDDPIANPKSAQDIFDCYPNADTSIALTQLADFNLRRVGHEGAFKKRCTPLWDQ